MTKTMVLTTRKKTFSIGTLTSIFGKTDTNKRAVA